MLKSARTLAPTEAELSRLSNLFKDGHFAQVESQAQSLAERYPACAQAWKLLGVSQNLQGKNGLMALRKSVELHPLDAMAHSNLGNAFKDRGQFEDAVAAYRRAIKLKPDLAGIHYNLGLTLMDLSQFGNALTSFLRALALKPDFAEVHNDAGNALLRLGQLEKSLSSYRQALAIKPDYFKAYSNMLFVLNYTSNYTSSYCLEQAKLYGRLAASKALKRFATWECIIHPERLRVGIVSGDLHNHPVGYFLESLLTRLDPARIELIAYSTQFKEDSLSIRIKPHFVAWKSLVSLSDEAAARLIHADGVHVLLDLSGHTEHNRLPVFAFKPAPVQATWLGYFATTGVAEMDYLIADRVGVPEAHRESFTETVWYLPDTRLCFSPPLTDLQVAPMPEQKNGFITFGCFQNLAKVGDKVLKTWSSILAALPDARMRWQCNQFKDPAVVQQLSQRLRKHGIDVSRVSLLGSVSREAYLAAHAEVDMVLDTFPYPGGTTTCEALWMGVPTLTLAGDSLLARQGASLLSAADLGVWVASSEEEYVNKAVSLASDRAGLAELRTTLRAKVLTTPLFDATRFARNFEDALWGMWNKYQQLLSS